MADVDVARTIAEEVRSSGRTRTWRKVTTILSAFGAYRLTDGVRQRIAVAFSEVGLCVEPSLLEIDRSSTVRLSLADAEVPAPATSWGTEFDGVRIWHRGAAEWLPETSILRREGLTLVDLDLSIASGPGLEAALLGAHAGLDRDSLADLLTPDSHGSFKRSAKGAARKASLMIAELDPGEASPDDDKSVRIALGLVEFAVGTDWVITARQPAQVYVSGSADDQVRRDSDAYVGGLDDHGLAEAESPEEVALAIIHHAVSSFAVARAELASWVQTWRDEFARHPTGDRDLLIGVQATLPLVIDALEPLRHPTVLTWLGAARQPEARDIRDQVDRELEALRGLSATTAEALMRVDQLHSEHYQRGLATLAAVLLAPGLVASIFSANTSLSDSPWDLLWLALTMLLAGGLTQLVITRRLRLQQ